MSKNSNENVKKFNNYWQTCRIHRKPRKKMRKLKKYQKVD